MDSVMHFLAMGGYAAYVWPAYGLTFLVLGGFTILGVRRYQAATRALAAHGGDPR